MVSVNLKSLVGKLNDPGRRTLEAAAGLCLSRSHYNVEVEHWLLKLVEAPDTDLTSLLKHYGVDASRLLRDLTRAIDRFKTGNSRAPTLSPHLVELARETWVVASLEYGAARARTGHVLVALLADDDLSRLAREASAEFGKVPPDALRKDLPALTADSPEGPAAGATAAPGPGQAPAPGGKTPSLDQFTIDLTARARAGQIDPVLGRDAEIRQLIDILTRRRQNNPILTGEAGVGKTAVAEGFALRVAAGDVPEPLKNVALRTLDLGLLQAGAGVKGEFENRLKSVIDEVKASPTPIILFIDEDHTMIGAGGQAGQTDAANLLKPALARGELRTIAATTWAEYKKYFERDAALARRFQVVKVEEPDEPAAVEMMHGLLETLEKHHGVRILDEAVRDSVRLSARYIAGRQLPDKSVSLLDTACARVRLSHTTTPPALEDCRRRIGALTTDIGALQRETAAGGDHADRLGELTAEKAAAEEELKALEARWQEELRLVGEVRALRDRLEGRPAAEGAGAPPTPGEADELRGRLAGLTAQLRQVQGEAPLVSVCVDSQAVAGVVSNWTGIPVGRMVRDEIAAVLSLKDRLTERVVGQPHALEAIAQRVRTARAGLTDPRRPVGVFLLVGTSGVGKTETALALAEVLYGGEQNLTTLNMSEFKEEHKVSLLMGSPPGYVGYGEGGVLTEAVRRRPYGVLLLDEMEKAHPGVQDVFYQVFDKGTMRDGEGRDIDFKNTLIMMTSNAGTETIHKLFADPETAPDAAGLTEALRPDLLKVFKPAFLGRVTLVPYFPLAEDVLRQIVKLQLGRVARRVRESHRASFTYSPELVAAIAARCTEVQSGARNIDHIISRTLLPQLAAEFLGRLSQGESVTAVNVTVDDSGDFRYEIS
ncbi:MAG TPA: type VI secretion system ATPase TssH [Gemmataceae bacterium]|nr:type VI secretion system ATPase TssH [Gemmataceae bacterium]